MGSFLQFKQICVALCSNGDDDTHEEALYGLTDDGMVYEYDPNLKHWEQLAMRRAP